MLQIWVPLFLSFLIAFVAGTMVWWRLSTDRRQQKVKSMIAAIDMETATTSTTVLELPQTSFLERWGGGRFKGEAAMGKNTLIATVGMALVGAISGSLLTDMIGAVAIVMGAIVFGALPAVYHSRKTRARLVAFEEQFPDALDFLARSVRAGNAFSMSLELVAAESPEPLRKEFLRISREQALGASLDMALNGLVARIPIVEVRFFVSVVLLQRETGGNLAEILGKLAGAVRERLRLRGHVKAASSQARLTAHVLSALPVVVLILLKVISPGYLDGLTGNPTGRMMLAAAVCSQLLAYLCMKKIADIEV